MSLSVINFPSFSKKILKRKQKENVNKKFIHLLNHDVTYAPPYIKYISLELVHFDCEF